MTDEQKILRASTPDPDASDCEYCGGGLAHFPECVVNTSRTTDNDAPAGAGDDVEAYRG